MTCSVTTRCVGRDDSAFPALSFTSQLLPATQRQSEDGPTMLNPGCVIDDTADLHLNVPSAPHR
jgi:hypothetical protein